MWKLGLNKESIQTSDSLLYSTGSFFRALDTGTGSENPSGSHSTGDTESMEDSQDLPDCSGNKSENDSDEDLS